MSQGVHNLSCKVKCRKILSSAEVIKITNRLVHSLTEATHIGEENLVVEVKRRDPTDESNDPEIAF
jgi:hypothetical protein